MKLMRWVCASIVMWTLCPFCLAQQEDSDRPRTLDKPTASSSTGILLVDERFEPIVTVRWESMDGMREISGPLPYGPPAGGEVLQSTSDDDWDGGNIRAYVALGGSRLDSGDGHPKGLIMRAGLTKVDNTRAFFDRIVPGSVIEIELSGVVLSEAVKYHEGTGMMHLKYAIGDLEACSLPGTARNQYLMSDPHDTMSGRVQAGVNATPGALDGSGEGSFEVRIDPEDPTRAGFLVRVPYGMLRNLLDPWESELPNTFFEPIHFHAEAEVIPVWATPTQKDWALESNDPVTTDDEAEDDGAAVDE